MKLTPKAKTLALLLSVLLAGRHVVPLFADDGSAPTSAASAASDARIAKLTAYVTEIAGSPSLTPAEKEKKIATLVRIRIVSETAALTDPSAIATAAKAITDAATAAAPACADAIATAALAVPSVAAVPGITDLISPGPAAPALVAETPAPAQPPTEPVAEPAPAPLPAAFASSAAPATSLASLPAASPRTIAPAPDNDAELLAAEAAAASASREAALQRDAALRLSARGARTTMAEAVAKLKAADAALTASAAAEIAVQKISAALAFARRSSGPATVARLEQRLASAEQLKTRAQDAVTRASREATEAALSADKALRYLATLDPALIPTEPWETPAPSSSDVPSFQPAPFPPSPNLVANENYSLRLSAGLNARHDDNIFLTKDDRVEDQIYSFSPTATLLFGNNSLVSGNLILREDFMRYAKRHDKVNLASLQGRAAYQDAKLKASLNASHRQLYQNDQSVSVAGKREIVRRNESAAAARAELPLTSKLGLGTGADWSRTDYRTTGLTDHWTVGAPLSLYFNATPKTDLSLGYAQRNTYADKPAIDSTDHSFSLGSRGAFTPRLTGSFSGSYRTREPDTGAHLDMWGFDGDFAYEVTPKTGATLGLSRDFDTGPLGETVRHTAATLALNTAFDERLSAGLSLTYRDVNYDGKRDEEYWEGTLNAAWQYNRRTSLSAGYTHRNNRSSVSSAGYSGNILFLGVGVALD